MPTYRAYRLDEKKRLKSGSWITASSDQEAKRKAADLCEDGATGIEVWRDANRIDEIDCEPSSKP